MANPLLSIVIANYNYGRFLEAAIESVASQSPDGKVELIICDAGSTDNSLETIKEYANGLPAKTSYEKWLSNFKPKQISHCSQLVTWWCSEKDGGQSAAFNKGFAHARGEWLTWLNADDLLLPGTLKAFEDLVRKKPNAEWVTGNKVHFESNTGKILSVNWGPHYQPPVLSKRRAFSAVYGPTSFFKKSLYLRMGVIDERLHYAMDTDYWARLTMAGVRQTRLNHLCWGFRVHSESKTEGEQSKDTKARRMTETAYWQEKTGYRFRVGFKNPYYIAWLLWRVIDGSLLIRQLLKLRFQGKSLSKVISNY